MTSLQVAPFTKKYFRRGGVWTFPNLPPGAALSTPWAETLRGRTGSQAHPLCWSLCSSLPIRELSHYQGAKNLQAQPQE